MILPQNNKLPISALAGIFSNISAAYKFYWFVALLDIVVKELDERSVSLKYFSYFCKLINTYHGQF